MTGDDKNAVCHYNGPISKSTHLVCSRFKLWHLHRWDWWWVEFLLRHGRLSNTILLPSLCSSVSVFQLLKDRQTKLSVIPSLQNSLTDVHFWAKYLIFFPLQLLQLGFCEFWSSLNFQILLKRPERRVLISAARTGIIIQVTIFQRV